MKDIFKNKYIYISFFIFSIIMIFLGFYASPSFFAKYFSHDHILAPITVMKIHIIRYIFIIFWFVILLYSIMKVIKYDYVRKLDKKIWEFLCSRLSKRILLVWFIFFLIIITSGLRIIKLCVNDKWPNVNGYEYFWISEAIAGGHGYSLAAEHRWFFYDFKSEVVSEEYFPTTLEEPVYPYLMALSVHAFGRYGKLGILVFQELILLLSCFCIYHLGRKVFNFQTGIFAAFILSRWPPTHYLAGGVLSVAMLAGFMVIISAYVFIWCLERVSVRRGIIVGSVLGLSCLTFAPTLPFVPIMVILLLLSARPFMPVVWKTALSVLLVAGIIVAPWTIRNFLVFGEFVPVRTGFGLATHQGNPILAGTFAPGPHACTDTLGPLWRARNIREALVLPREDTEKRFAIYKRSFDCVEQNAPDGYETFNEAQRDKVYLGKTLEFIFSQPRIFATLTYNRLLLFFRGWSARQSLVSLLALSGALLALHNRKARVLILLALAFTFPYGISVPWRYGYRYPIEPVFLLFACYLAIFVLLQFNDFRLRLTTKPAV